MTSLTAIFGNTQEDSGDSEKLLELYWNRAELKKEFASLRDETFRLKKKIAAKEGCTARVQQKLDHLEDLLLDPDWVYNVIVYYQLRAFNQRCKSKLARFAEQLKQQREQRQQSKVVDVWNDQRNEEAQALQARLGEQRMQMQMLEDQLQSERHRFSMMGGFARFFRKRSITKTLDGIAGRMGEAQLRESELVAALEEINSRAAPDTEGLDIASKRSINFMILSFAQQMYLQFQEDGLAGMAKESGDKSAGAINYGTKADCDLILEAIRQRGDAMDNVSDYADVLQQRAKLIAEKALFKLDDDAVPVAGSVSTVYSFDQNGVLREKDANLIGEDYWELANVLSR
ncbi:MAG: hypothetical protein O7F72_02705 [Proteobacteria bacterium]|nr:hypothetical protein [Pseudomonadota bacterium]